MAIVEYKITITMTQGCVKAAPFIVKSNVLHSYSKMYFPSLHLKNYATGDIRFCDYHGTGTKQS